MTVEQIYTGCLAQGAYYITSNGEAAIIDPLRETQPYISRLAKDRVKLKYIFETHFHADFVSGHIDLSKKTNAPIVYGPNANPEFEAIIASDNQIFEIGDVKIKVMHTPGHTLESSCYLLIDENGKETALFSGDTLFLGDVGRPDLAQKAGNITQEELAGLLYDSLYNKILPLADDITIYPAHGAGSACGKNMMKETVDSLGNQKKINYALNQPTRDAFIEAVTDGLLPPPAYFGMNVAMNKKGYSSFDEVLNQGMKALSPAEFETTAENTAALILDTRSNQEFANGFIPQAVNIGLAGDFAPWVGAMIVDVKQPILLVTDAGQEEEAVTRLSRVGFDHVLGHLAGGFEAWKNAGKEIDSVKRISAERFASEVKTGAKIIDVRKESEYAAEHIEEAYSRPLANINDWVKDINPQEHFYVHCAGGYRSMIAASILQARGYRNFTEIAGGFNAIAKTDIPKTDFVCQSKVLKIKNSFDTSYWNTRWENGTTGWDIGQASPAITEYLSQYPNKDAAILIPGCGNAYEAEYLLKNGFTNITLIDIAPKAVDLLKDKFKKNPQIKVLCEDFFQHHGSYDLIIEQTFFCAILPEKRNEYAEKMASLLNKNGKIIGVLFDKTFEQKGPPFGGSPTEYKSIFGPNFIIKTMEKCYNSIQPRANSEVFVNLIKK